jgi:predicted Fe-Mo cluster-binding NifX family protein
MKIAVTYDGQGDVFQHFGKTQYFKLYEIEGDQVVKSEVIDNNGLGHGALAGLLAQHHVDVLIAGGMGMGARNALASHSIEVIPGVSGKADEAVTAYLNKTLSYDPDAHCDHHGEEHNCDHHSC